MPAIVIGTWPFEGDEARDAVALALEVGFRGVDTAFNYGNEVEVGRAIRESGIPRDELFITSKFNKEDHGVDEVRRAYDRSLRRLGLDHLDLFLCHWPVPGQDRYVDAWRGQIRLVEEGLVGAIGVSNFTPGHLRRIVAETGYVPDVDQIQLSADIARVEARAAHRELGIQTEAWSPLGRAGALFREPAVVAIAERIGRSVPQVLLRWTIQHDIVPVPRSGVEAELREDLDVFSFALDAPAMAALDALDRGEAAARDSDDPVNGH
jgi:2,5-diketo-D-gluconate reductase A